jgi:hypothetical protein
VGAPPLAIGTGGTIPIMSTLASLDVPTVLTGFALPDDAVHTPNESYRLESLRLGDATARELYSTLSQLPHERRKDA